MPGLLLGLAGAFGVRSGICSAVLATGRGASAAAGDAGCSGGGSRIGGAVAQAESDNATIPAQQARRA